MRALVETLLGACLVLLAASDAIADPRGGTVTYATAKRAYLDAGARDGLHLGDVIKLLRNERPVGDCKIDQLADSSASCPVAARAGDRFALARPRSAAAATAATASRLRAETIDTTAAQATLAATPVEQVEFHGGRAGGSALPVVSVSLGHTAFVTVGGGQFEQERLDLQLSGLDLRFAGFRGEAMLSALYYTTRPDVPRFRPGDDFQLYVWQTEVSSREVGRPFVLSVGRVWPHHAPGLVAVDGVQGGWRSRSGDVEIGAIGGTLPDAVTLYPTAHWIAGLYYGATHASSRKDALVRLVQHEARLSLRDVGTGDPQLVLEGDFHAWLGRRFDLGAETRATLGAGDWTTPRFEAARASFGFRPTTTVHSLLDFRYLGPREFDPEGFAPGLFSTGTWYYSDADVVWDVRPWLSLRAYGGGAERTDTALGREYVGGELGFPTALHGGSLVVGYREEFGWDAGRTAHVQLGSPADARVRFLVRASYFEDHYDGSDAVLRELGLYLHADARLVRWLSLRLSALGRADLQHLGATPSGGLTARLDLAGAW